MSSLVCRIDVDTSKPENIISSRDMPPYFKERANMTGDVLDCTWVAYANKGERVSNEYHNTMLPIEP